MWIAEERSLLREQSLQQAFVLDIRVLHCAQKVEPANELLVRHVFLYAQREEALAGFVEQNASALLNERGEFTDFVLGNDGRELSVSGHQSSGPVGFWLRTQVCAEGSLVTEPLHRCDPLWPPVPGVRQPAELAP